MNRLNESANFNDINNKIIILFFSHVNDFRYIKIKKQNALLIVRIYDKLIFFCYFHLQFRVKKIKKKFAFQRFFRQSFKFRCSNFLIKVEKVDKKFY